jgi:hypothetical protein
MTDSGSSFEALQTYNDTFPIISNGFLAIDFQSYIFRKNVKKRKNNVEKRRDLDLENT